MNISKIILEKLKNITNQSDSNPKFGAVLVKNEKVIAEGFAHTTSKFPCSVEEFLAHAEESAIFQALNNNIDLSGVDLYVFGLREDRSVRLTDGSYCCANCSRMIKQTKIENIYYPVKNGWESATKDEMFEKALNRE